MAITYTLCKENCKTGIDRMSIDILLGEGYPGWKPINPLWRSQRFIMQHRRQANCWHFSLNILLPRECYVWQTLWNLKNYQEYSFWWNGSRQYAVNKHWWSSLVILDRAAVADYSQSAPSSGGAAACLRHCTLPSSTSTSPDHLLVYQHLPSTPLWPD